MKKLLLSFFIIIASLTASAQYLDTITFEKHRELIKIDTSQKNNIWQIGRPQKTFFDSAYSKPYAIVTDTINPYPTNNTSSFIVIIPSTNAPFGKWGSCNVPFITYWEKYNMDTLKDSGVITLSVNGGKTWVPLDTYCRQTASSNNYNSAFTGTSHNWEQGNITYVPSNYCAVNSFPFCDTVLLKFTFYSDSVNSNKEGWMIDNIVFGWNFCEGINEHSRPESFINVFPNPASTTITLSCQTEQGNHSDILRLYNTMGQLLKSENVNSNTMQEDVSALPNGIYYYTLSVDGVVEATNKIAIIR